MNYNKAISAADIRRSIEAAHARMRSSNLGVTIDMEDRASLKGERSHSEDQGAHLLSLVSREEVLNTCAPDGTACQQGGFVNSQPGCKGHAPVGDEPEQACAVELRSPITGNEEPNGCADEDPEDEAFTYDPDFYQIKVDLFHNKGKRNSTEFRANIHVRPLPTTSDSDAVKMVADFYNRPRDINKRLKDMQLEHHAWYAEFRAAFQKWNDLKVTWTIPPKMAVLKELVRNGSQIDGEVLGFAGALIAQIEGEAHPMVVIWYHAFRRDVDLNVDFARGDKTGNLIHKGIHRDATRLADDVEQTATKPKYKIRKF